MMDTTENSLAGQVTVTDSGVPLGSPPISLGLNATVAFSIPLDVSTCCARVSASGVEASLLMDTLAAS